MFEALDRANRRDAGRRTLDDLQPPVVRNLNDIRRIISEYDPVLSHDRVPVRLTTTLRGLDENDKLQTYRVTAETLSKTRRTILLEGFETIRRQAEIRKAINDQTEAIEVNGRLMFPPKLAETEVMVYIDPLIRRWMNGERRGTFICWDLVDGYTYKYDIFAHKLSRTKLEESNNTI